MLKKLGLTKKSVSDPLKDYLQSWQKALVQGGATEHIHRPGPKALLESLFPETTATNEAKPGTDCGKPDMTGGAARPCRVILKPRISASTWSSRLMEDY